MADKVVSPGASMRRLDPAARLTVDSSADAFEYFLSKEDGETPKAEPKAKAEPEPKPEVKEPEPVAEPEAAEPEPEAAAADDEEPEAAPEVAPEPRKFRVKAGDVDEEVTEDELLKGYLRQSDYTRKTQAVAEERKKAEADFQAVKAEREHYAKYLVELRDVLTKQTPEEPNWVERAKVLSPEQYTAEHAAWTEHKKNVAIVEQRAKEAQEAVARDKRKEWDSYLSSEHKKLLDAVPAWKDLEVAEKERRELWDFGEKVLGYSKQELDGISDHRAILALRKAYKADKTEEKKPIVRQQLQEIKAASPGPAGGTQKRAATEVEKRYARAKKTGDWKDAGKLIEAILPD